VTSRAAGVILADMKTLTVTISDEAAAKLADHAAQNKQSAEQMAARAVEDAYGADWYDALDDEGRSALAEGVAEADRSEFASDKDVDEAYRRLDR
jgi:predicted transcriptional regulator